VRFFRLGLRLGVSTSNVLARLAMLEVDLNAAAHNVEYRK